MSFKQIICDYSTALGNDPMLVQGAGGNISWKDGDTLWIKASGTWLAEANTRNIFIPLGLTLTRTLIAAEAHDLSAALLEPSPLRPSIETSLHTLLPQAIVVHIHAVEVLALSVLSDGRAQLSQRLGDRNWLWVDYTKPGAPLAQAITEAMKSNAVPDIIVLGNHGLILAGNTLDEIHQHLHDAITRCEQNPRVVQAITEDALQMLASQWYGTGYSLPENLELHALARDPISQNIARAHWVMYPDHAVFLGAAATFAAPLQSPADFVAKLDPKPACILIADIGIVVRDDLNAGQKLMLDCYRNVTARIYNPSDVHSLSVDQIGALLNWDAEKYRQAMNEAR